MVEVCLLGCGGMVPLPNRRLTAMMFRHKGKIILIDCGEGTQVSIKLAGWGFKSIEAICFTHYHADHIAGLPGFLLTLGNSGRVEPFTIFGPPPLPDVIKALTIIAPELPYKISLVELSQEFSMTNQVEEIYVNSIPVNHSIPCLAYRLDIRRTGKFNKQKAIDNNIPINLWSHLQKGIVVEHNGTRYEPGMVLGNQRKGIKVAYCTDTRPTNNLINFVKNSDLLFCEGMYGDDSLLQKAIERKHMTFSEAASLAKISGVKELCLTHYSPSLDNPDIFIDNAKNIFKNTIAGKDLTFKTLNFDYDLNQEGKIEK